MTNVIEKAEDYLSSATTSREVLRDRLSEFLAIEKGGLKLYEQALRIVSDSDLRKKFSEFRDQTRKHETILISVIHEQGMDPAYLMSKSDL
jgi:rubrerythrin